MSLIMRVLAAKSMWLISAGAIVVSAIVMPPCQTFVCSLPGLVCIAN
jgi:hypothetical protein